MLSERTSDKEVSKSLCCGWTEVTEGLFWSKHLDTVPEGKCIQKELVMGLPIVRKKRPTPNALPNILRRDCQL